ncbi:MAG TPA: diacylglycerol kinase family protein [Acidimicrobiales bacterium]
MGGPGYVVVANAAAGRASAGAATEAARVLGRAAATEVVETAGPDDLDRVVDRLAGRALVVVGGDGSLHAAVNALRRRGRLDAPLGLVPLGTGNDFARGLGLPLEAEAAATAVARAEPRPMDLVAASDGTAVVNVAHAGVGADAADAAHGVKRLLGKAAYPIGAAWAGLTRRGWQLEVEVDGRRVGPGTDGQHPDPPSGRVLLVAVANGRTIGGGTPVAPDARPDDGLVDVVVAASTGALARAGFARRLRAGRHLERPDVGVWQGREVAIRGEPVRHNVDGELTEPRDRVSYTVERGAWTLLAA